MATTPKTPAAPALEAVDAVARSAHLWIRSLGELEQLPAEERQALTGGLINGLCELMELDARVQEVAAYAIALLERGNLEPLAYARQISQPPEKPHLVAIYQRGREEAWGIVQMLRLHQEKAT